jgi:hypothetical protein
MYVVVPMWPKAALCHLAPHIETTSGWKEFLLHLLQLAEMTVRSTRAMLNLHCSLTEEVRV